MKVKGKRRNVTEGSNQQIPPLKGERGMFFKEVYKTIMGTIPRISSHSPYATEAAYGVRLLLFWPAAFPDTRPGFTTRGFPVLPVTA